MREERDWTFDGTWPHAPSWFDTADGRLHFVDVGPRAGPVVLLLHGNPTWGYLYRHFIPPLVAAGHRVIVPDHLGFGRSDKPAAPAAYGVERHALRLAALLDALAVRDVTLVAHDWGGPIGLHWATRNPARVARLVFLDTFLHRPLGPLALPLPLRLFRARGLGEALVKGLHALVRVFLFRVGLRRRERLTPTTRAAYLAPHPSWSSRTAILEFCRAFPDRPEGAVAELHGRIQAGLGALGRRPIFVAWGGHDVVFGPDVLARWLAEFPDAQVLRLPDAGHFVQEDAHELLVPALLAFLERGRRAA
jgi:pimeloyl-ACP methyl ester carboxylesterase